MSKTMCFIVIIAVICLNEAINVQEDSSYYGNQGGNNGHHYGTLQVEDKNQYYGSQGGNNGHHYGTLQVEDQSEYYGSQGNNGHHYGTLLLQKVAMPILTESFSNVEQQGDNIHRFTTAKKENMENQRKSFLQKEQSQG